jgi:hypothetical protein
MTRPNGQALVFATRSGGTTIDRDAFGGNPFATALIQLADSDRISLQQFPRRLRALTVQASQRHQVPQWTRWPERLNWSFQLRPGSRHERRCALVLGCSPARLRTAAISVDRIATACRATRFNLVFFAGCRTLAADVPPDRPLT